MEHPIEMRLPRITIRPTAASVLAACVLAALASLTPVEAQSVPGAGAAPPAPAPAQAEPVPPPDPLGRDTPRGTVLGFLSTSRKNEPELARQYLDTRLAGEAADALAQQLFVVLDARLPPQLMRISDAPEGSRSNPLTPDRELVATISSGRGNVEVFVDRVQRGKTAPVWLFSSRTLAAIPRVYEEVERARGSALVPEFLTSTRVASVRLSDWLAILLGIPIIYFATGLLNRLLVPLTRPLWRRMFGSEAHRNVLPAPARLLVLAFVGRWLLAMLPLSLVVRQFWSNAATLITIVASVWLLMLLSREVERHVHRRVPGSNTPAAAALVRVIRRTSDLVFILLAFLLTLRHFGIDPTPALAGLGVGGIAIALAAQKTLENVIAGASLIFDQAVQVGDFLKMGETLGTVDHIGLRSTRIRTLDRTIVSVPNGQIASASLETLSARDKYWFHPALRLRYDTTPAQLHAIVDGIRRLLAEHPAIDPDSVRVRFFGLGPSSLDVDIFAYLMALDWNHFLEMQEQLLFGVTEIVERSGTAIALPSQTVFMAREGAPAAEERQLPVG